MAINPHAIDKGSEWASIDKVFVVDDVILKEDGVWIYYHDQKTGDQYNCLANAFLDRFREKYQ